MFLKIVSLMCAFASADGKFYEPQPNQVVAKVSGQNIMGREIVPASTLNVQKGRVPVSTESVRMRILEGYVSALTDKIWDGFRERLVLENNIRASKLEIQEYIQAVTHGKKLSSKEKLALSSKAETEILNWKSDYSLYRKYGGRLAKKGERVFPADAQLKYLKEMESAGDFAIVHTELKDIFYAQYQEPRIHWVDAGLENPFESPWWLQKHDSL